MAALILQALLSFYAIHAFISLLIPAKTYGKFFVSKDYCTTKHDDTMCFLSNCRYHIILMGDFEVFVKKIDSFCFTYHHVYSLYTSFKYRFSDKIVAKSGQVFDTVQRGVFYIRRDK